MANISTPREGFSRYLADAIRTNSLLSLTLGKYKGVDVSLRNIYVRPVKLRGEAQYQFLWHHSTKDITKNHTPVDALPLIERLLGSDFHSAHLFTAEITAQLEYNKKGEPRLSTGKPSAQSVETAHDHAKRRLLPPESQDWLQALSVTTASGTPKVGMADKHRQIQRFVELLSHLSVEAGLPVDRPLEIADMGSGKGYLTFATSDFFNIVAGNSANVIGIETRSELVEYCQQVASQTNRERLRFSNGSIQDAVLPELDVLLALHACDTATDDAIYRGITAKATLLVVSPCCQKELRRQLNPAPVLAAPLRHGIFQERQAEFATDALRALLLEWAGYDTKVFEFISTEHTAKNLMISAIKRKVADSPSARDELAQAAREFAAFYGIRTHALARHLAFNLNASYIPELPQ